MSHPFKAPPREFIQRSRRNINLAEFSFNPKLHELNIGSWHFTHHPVPNILRMPLRNTTGAYLDIPEMLSPLRALIDTLFIYQHIWLRAHPFWYVTVRTEEVNDRSSMPHVDGFSQRYPHVPETNYVLTTDDPTEYWMDGIDFPYDFNGRVHNLNTYVAAQVKDKEPEIAEANCVYLLDPYIVHRRPMRTKRRTFFRLTNVPIEIEDDAQTPNPLGPQQHFGRVGSVIADAFVDYPGIVDGK